MIIAAMLIITSITISSCKNTEEGDGQMNNYDKTTGYAGEEISIRLPFTKHEIDAGTFGLKEDTIDNSFALMSAFVYCAQNPNTKLNIPKGVYRFDSSSHIIMDGAKDILIEGNGSEFIFADIGYPMFQNCDSVLVQNLFYDWDWQYQRLASVVEVEVNNKDNRTVDFVFPELEEVSEGMQWLTMNQMDPVSLTPGVEKGAEYWTGSLQFSNIEKISPNKLRVYHDGSLNGLKPGDVYLVRHVTYGGNPFTINACSNMSFKDITIYSGQGMGFLINKGTHHYQIRNCKAIIRPGSNRHIKIGRAHV